MPDKPIVIKIELPRWLVELLQGLLPVPRITAAGPMILVPHGQPLETSMSDIPLGKDGIQRLNPGNYDGPVTWSVMDGPAAVAAETADGTAGRIMLAEAATVGDEITVRAEADIRHGSGVVPSDADFVYSVVDKDAPPLTGAGFEVVDKA